MILYKMELYKICHKKVFIIKAALVIGILLFSFGMQVADEEATVDGIKYTGYKAVQVNRQITEEFKGVLTDEKVEKIIEKYGFPHKVEERYSYFRDANFLNQFVLNYLSNGYINNWNDYKVATDTYAIADSDLGKVMEFTGKEIIFEYYNGWRAFLEVLSIGMVMGSILILVSLSAVFSNEGQSNMLPLIFTAKKGRDEVKCRFVNDISAKIAAAFTAAIGVFLVIFLIDLILCGIIYGFDGLNCYNGMVVYYLFPSEERIIPMYYYIAMAVGFSFLGMLSLCAITICTSAYCKSNFHAVAASASVWGAPFLLAMLTDGFNQITRFLYAAPVFMVIYRVIEDIYNIWLMLVVISIIVSISCTVTAYRKYNRQQAV